MSYFGLHVTPVICIFFALLLFLWRYWPYWIWQLMESCRKRHDVKGDHEKNKDERQMREDPNEEYAELRMLYKINIDTIENAKNRQWRTTYYVLAVFVAIIGFGQAGSIDICGFTLQSKVDYLLIPAFFVHLLGTYHILDTHKIQCESRNKIEAIESQFIGKATEVCYKIDTGEREAYVKYSYYFREVVVPFYIMMLIGFLYVAWVVLSQEDVYSAKYGDSRQ